MKITGYGVCFDSKNGGAKFVDGGIEKFFRTFGMKSQGIRDKFMEFCEDRQEDISAEKDITPELIDLFVKQYENETYLWHGFGAVIVDTINYLEDFAGHDAFRVGDFCIYVEPIIPEDAYEAHCYPTKNRIRKIVQKYIRPFTKGDVTVDYVSVDPDGYPGI